jgi:cytochrome bd-type quinol oxidase subunit 1
MGCPMCLPLYAGLLSIIGIEIVDIHVYFFPVTIGFGLVTLGLMAYQIRTHNASWTPFQWALGAVAGMLVAAYFGYEYLLYAFLVPFMGCIIWNKRKLTHQGQKCC